jgi:hypothetical protein
MNERGGGRFATLNSQKLYENLRLKVDYHSVDQDPELLPWSDQK